MKKVLPLLAVLFACSPDVPQEAAPPPVIIANFDPGAVDANGKPAPVVPLPNDLAKDQATGKLVVTSADTDSDAQKEFNADYLTGLDGFPYESTASFTVSGDLDPASVTEQSVVVYDVTTIPKPVAIKPVYADKKISIAPPGAGWTKGAKYAVIALGNDAATPLKGAHGELVLGSPTWALVSSETPLVPCPDLKTDCKPAVDVIPSTETDPAAKLKDQTNKALQLEQLRLAYKPLLDGIQTIGHVQRSQVAIAWVFSITSASEVTFLPDHNVIPFPNNVVRDPTTSKVKLPNPKTGAPLTADDCKAPTDQAIALYCGLNTLDGFSTLVPPISENSDTLGALEQGNIDEKSLSQQSVGLVKLATDAPMPIQTDPNWTPCLNCSGSAKSPQTLQWNLNAPLDERTTYLAYVSTDVKDDKGQNVIPNPIMALVRSKAPLVTPDGKSSVNILSDDQAKQLEPLRAALAPALDGIAAKGLDRKKLALAWGFTTQTEGSDLAKIQLIPFLAGQMGLPNYPLFVHDVTALVKANAATTSIPVSHIKSFFVGAILTPVAVTGPFGTLNPTAPSVQPVAFIMSVPDSTASGVPPAGPNGYAVTIFGHGLTRSRNDFLPFADAAAQAGQIVIATDVLFHGERTSCTGSKTATADALPMGTMPSDDFACADPTTMKCDEGTPVGLCVLRDDTQRTACTYGSVTDGDGKCATAGQGRCGADGKCQGPAPTCVAGPAGDVTCAQAGKGICAANGFCTMSNADLARDATGLPKISGWNIFSLTNFFATRDNFRQQVIDLAQLVTVLKGNPAGKSFALQLAAANGGAIAYDVNHLNYIGQSLGGILGTLFNAVSQDTHNVALNVPGGALSKLVLDSPDLAKQRNALVETLKGQGIMVGTSAFDQFIGVAQWVLDPADPANMGYMLTHGAPADRKAFLQFIEGDQFVINESNFALVAGANRMFNPMAPPSFGCQAPLFCYEFTEKGDGFDQTSLPLDKRHGFLLNFADVAVTAKAQTQAAKFLATGNFQ